MFHPKNPKIMNNAVKNASEVAQIKELIKPAKREADVKEVASLCEGFSATGGAACPGVFASVDNDEDILF